MDEGVPDSTAPAPIFLGDVDSVEEVLEPKPDKIDILGFAGGFVTPPALFVLLWGFGTLVILSHGPVIPIFGIGFLCFVPGLVFGQLQASLLQ